MNSPFSNRLLCAVAILEMAACAPSGGPFGGKSVRQSLPLIEKALKEKRFPAADSLAQNAGGRLGFENARRAKLKRDVASSSLFLAKIGECEVREIKQAGVESLNACYDDALASAAAIGTPTEFSGEFGQFLRSKAQTAQRKRNKFAAYREKTASTAGRDLSPNQMDKWVKSGFEPAEIGAWYGRGFPPAEAAEWKGKAFDPEAAADWKSGGFDPESASVWKAGGFAKDSALAWKAVGFDREAAAHWNGKGLAPEAAKGWSVSGFAAEEVADWLKCFSAPDSAAVWKQKGDSATAACEHRQLLVQSSAPHQGANAPASVKSGSRPAHP